MTRPLEIPDQAVTGAWNAAMKAAGDSRETLRDMLAAGAQSIVVAELRRLAADLDLNTGPSSHCSRYAADRLRDRANDLLLDAAR